jgi:hypothetical protein
MATFRERPGAAGTHATIFPVSARPTPTGPMSGDRASRNQVPVGWVRLEPEDHSDLAILVELGDDVPDLDQGYGGWTATPRQRNLALTTWQGFDPRPPRSTCTSTASKHAGRSTASTTTSRRSRARPQGAARSSRRS